MKKLLIFTVIFLLLVLGGVSFYIISNSQALLAQFKPQLERIATRALGTPVEIGKLNLELSLAPKISIDELRVGRTATSAGVGFQNIFLAVDLMPLLSKELTVTKLGISDPSITLIKGPDGIQLEGLPSKKPSLAPADDKATPEMPPGASTPSDGEGSDFKFALKSFELRNGTLRLRDLTTAQEYVISELTVDSGVSLNSGAASLNGLKVALRALDAVNISLAAPAITFTQGDSTVAFSDLTASFLNATTKLSGKVRAKDLIGTIEIALRDLNLKELKPLAKLVPALSAFQPSGDVASDLVVNLSGPGAVSFSGALHLTEIAAKVGILAITDLTGKVDYSGDLLKKHVQITELPLKVNGAPVTFSTTAQLEGTQLTLAPLAMKGFGGALKGDVGLAMSAPQTFSTTMAVSGMSIDALMQVLSPGKPSALEGQLEQFSIQTTGTLGPDLMQTLAGNGSVLVRDATVKQFNLVENVLKSINSIPFISGALWGSVPEDRAGDVGGEDTRISRLSSTFTLGAGRMNTRDFNMLGTFYSVDGSGSAGFDSSIDLQTTIIFDKDFSAGLARKTKEISQILDSEGRLVVPLVLSGVVPKILVIPNVEKLITMGAKNVVRDRAEKTFDKLLGKEGSGVSRGLSKALGF